MSILSKTIQGIFGAKRPVVVPAETGLPNIEEIRQMEGGSIICFAAASEGNALTGYTREHTKSLAEKASRVLVIDLNAAKWQSELNEALLEPVWFVYSFFGVGQEINFEMGGGIKNLWEAAKIPFVRVYGDIPAYFPDKHIGKYLNSINLYGDRRFSNFYQKWFDDRALTVTPSFFPFSLRALDEVDRDLKLRGSIIFPKNGNSPTELVAYWRSALPSTVSSVLEAIAEECTSSAKIDGDVAVDDTIIRFYQDTDIGISANRALLCFLVAQVDDYMRRFKSTLIAEALLDLPVIVRGKNWEHVNFQGRRAKLDTDSDFATTEPLLDGAPAMLDMSPNTVDSPHDRVLRAVGRGTAFLTNQQKFADRLMLPSPGCTFSFNKNSVHDLVEHYVLNPSDAVELGLTQSKALREMYTPDVHAEVVMSAVQLMTLRLGGRPWGTQNFVDFPPQLFR